MTDIELEDVGDTEVRHRFDRGDYRDPEEVKRVKKWLRAKDKERDFLAACERASMLSALEASRAARRANLIAFLALIISAISAREQLTAIVGAFLKSFAP
jgi:hypothetical protein